MVTLNQVYTLPCSKVAKPNWEFVTSKDIITQSNISLWNPRYDGWVKTE